MATDTSTGQRTRAPDLPQELVDIGGLFGGIAGFHHLVVKVRHVVSQDRHAGRGQLRR
jgi:hypothetical protein